MTIDLRTCTCRHVYLYTHMGTYTNKNNIERGFGMANSG